MGITKQRREILNILANSGKHMTADQVFDAARHSFPNIGRGTVYRNLNIMADEDVIWRLHVPNQPTLFDPSTYPHQHMLCVKCGKVMDICDIEYDTIRKLVSEHVEIIGSTTIVYVVCEDCAE